MQPMVTPFDMGDDLFSKRHVVVDYHITMPLLAKVVTHVSSPQPCSRCVAFVEHE